jgi:hypothetical protein
MKMKTKILLLALCTLLFALPAEARPKDNFPFAPKGKYGKLRTKQARYVKQKEAWIYRQWGRN